MTIQKLENPDVYPGLSTENKLHIIQHALLPFAAHPEEYNFDTDDQGNKIAYFGGFGVVRLSVDQMNTSTVTFESERDFRVVAEFRNRSGIYTEPTNLRRYGAVSVFLRLDEQEASYLPVAWKDGGFSMRKTAEDEMPIDVIDQVTLCVEGLHAIHNNESRQLSLVN